MLWWVPFKVALHFLLKFKPFDEFFPFQNVISNLFVFVAGVCVCVCVYIHWMKTSLKLSLALFSVPSSKDGRMGRFWGRSLFPLCWRLNHLKCDGQCLFLSHCDSCSACEKSFLTGKECAYCRLSRPKIYLYSLKTESLDNAILGHWLA